MDAGCHDLSHTRQRRGDQGIPEQHGQAKENAQLQTGRRQKLLAIPQKPVVVPKSGAGSRGTGRPMAHTVSAVEGHYREINGTRIPSPVQDFDLPTEKCVASTIPNDHAQDIH